MIHTILQRLETLFKTDVRYLIKGTFWMNANRGISVLCGLALSVSFAHLLSKEEFGIYAFVLAALGLFSMPMTTALGAGTTKGIARGNHRILFEGLRKVFPYSLAAAGILVGLGVYYLWKDNIVLAISFMIGGIVLPLSVSNSIAKSFLGAKADFERITLFNSIRTPIVTIIMIFVAWYFSSVLAVILTSIISGTLLSFWLYRDTRKRYALDQMIDNEDTFAGTYAFHSAVLSIFSYLSEKIDNFLLWKLAGATPVALYTYAMSPVREIRSLIESQSTLAIPKFAQKSFEEVRSNISLRVKQLYVIAIPITVIYILAAPYIFHILFPQYVSVIGLSQLAAVSLLSAPRRMIQAVLSAHQRVKESYITIVVPNVVRIILALILIPLYSLTGAVVAILISEIIDFIILGILMRTLR